MENEFLVAMHWLLDQYNSYVKLLLTILGAYLQFINLLFCLNLICQKTNLLFMTGFGEHLKRYQRRFLLI